MEYQIKPVVRAAFIILATLMSVAAPVFGKPEGRAVDRAHSTVTVYVGILSGLAHNHEIEAPIEWCEVNDSEKPSVELRVNSAKLRVLDREVSDDTRAKIQETMQGAAVLDVGRFPEIHFQSTQHQNSSTISRFHDLEHACKRCVFRAALGGTNCWPGITLRNGTFDCSRVDKKPGIRDKPLSRMVGTIGFACPERDEGKLRPCRPGRDAPARLEDLREREKWSGR